MVAVAFGNSAVAVLDHALATIGFTQDLEIVIQATGGSARLVAQALAVDAQHLEQLGVLRGRVHRAPGFAGQAVLLRPGDGDDVLRQRLPAAVMQQIDTALGKAMAGYEQRLRDSGQLLHSGAETVAAQMRKTESLSRHVAWKVLASAVAALALLLGGGIYLSMQYRQQIRDNRLQAELLRAYNQADVTLCGERLCANVDLKAKGAGPQGQYRPVQLRR